MPGLGDALLVVDVQNDFLPGGSLGIAQGDRVLPPANRCIELFARRRLPVFLGRDWHPPEHCSFHAQGGPWPRHCVAGSPGAEFVAGLVWPPGMEVVSKATRAEREAYSSFDGTQLEQRLKALAVSRLFIVGLATDYCVLHTVRDAVAAGLSVVVLHDAIAAGDVHPGDGDRAIEQMRTLGATVVDSNTLAAPAAPTPGQHGTSKTV